MMRAGCRGFSHQVRVSVEVRLRSPGDELNATALQAKAVVGARCHSVDVAYTPLRHAHIGEKEIHADRLLPVEWVMLSRWDHDSGVVEFCLEYLDDRTETAADDDSFESLEDAEHYATVRFNLSADDWCDGTPLPL